MTGKESARIVAVDLTGDGDLIAEASTSSLVSVQETTAQGFEEELKRMIDGAPDVLVTTLESLPRVSPYARDTPIPDPLPRLCAIYWRFREQVKDDPCVVLSVGRQSAAGGLILGGRLSGASREDPKLSLNELWRTYVDSKAPLKAVIKGRPEMDEPFFQSFCNLLRKGEPAQLGPLKTVRPPLKLDSSTAALQAFIGHIDPSNSARWLILADWAGSFCNLDTLLASEGREVCFEEPDKAFQVAARGLILYGLHSVKKTAPAPSVSSGVSASAALPKQELPQPSPIFGPTVTAPPADVSVKPSTSPLPRSTATGDPPLPPAASKEKSFDWGPEGPPAGKVPAPQRKTPLVRNALIAVGAVVIVVALVIYFSWQQPPQFTPLPLKPSEAVLREEFSSYRQELKGRVCEMVRETRRAGTLNVADRAHIIDVVRADKTKLEALAARAGVTIQMPLTNDEITATLDTCLVEKR